LLAQQQLQGVAHSIDPSGALGLSLTALQDSPELQKLFRFSEPPKSRTVPRLRQWQEPLQELAAAPVITYGSPVELSSYKEFVRSRIAEAKSAASANWEWRDSGLLQYLDKAMTLVEEENTGLGRQKAVELLGFCTLAERFHAGVAPSGKGLSFGSVEALIFLRNWLPNVCGIIAEVRGFIWALPQLWCGRNFFFGGAFGSCRSAQHGSESTNPN
jgi:hypothetical protein